MPEARRSEPSTRHLFYLDAVSLRVVTATFLTLDYVWRAFYPDGSKYTSAYGLLLCFEMATFALMRTVRNVQFENILQTFSLVVTLVCRIVLEVLEESLSQFAFSNLYEYLIFSLTGLELRYMVLVAISGVLLKTVILMLVAKTLEAVLTFITSSFTTVIGFTIFYCHYCLATEAVRLKWRPISALEDFILIPDLEAAWRRSQTEGGLSEIPFARQFTERLSGLEHQGGAGIHLSGSRSRDELASSAEKQFTPLAARGRESLWIDSMRRSSDEPPLMMHGRSASYSSSSAIFYAESSSDRWRLRIMQNQGELAGRDPETRVWGGLDAKTLSERLAVRRRPEQFLATLYVDMNRKKVVCMEDTDGETATTTTRLAGDDKRRLLKPETQSPLPATVQPAASPCCKPMRAFIQYSKMTHFVMERAMPKHSVVLPRQLLLARFSDVRVERWFLLWASSVKSKQMVLTAKSHIVANALSGLLTTFLYAQSFATVDAFSARHWTILVLCALRLIAQFIVGFIIQRQQSLENLCAKAQATHLFLRRGFLFGVFLFTLSCFDSAMIPLLSSEGGVGKNGIPTFGTICLFATVALPTRQTNFLVSVFVALGVFTASFVVYDPADAVAQTIQTCAFLLVQDMWIVRSYDATYRRLFSRYALPYIFYLELSRRRREDSILNGTFTAQATKSAVLSGASQQLQPYSASQQYSSTQPHSAAFYPRQNSDIHPHPRRQNGLNNYLHQNDPQSPSGRYRHHEETSLESDFGRPVEDKNTHQGTAPGTRSIPRGQG